MKNAETPADMYPHAEQDPCKEIHPREKGSRYRNQSRGRVEWSAEGTRERFSLPKRLGRTMGDILVRKFAGNDEKSQVSPL